MEYTYRFDLYILSEMHQTEMLGAFFVAGTFVVLLYRMTMMREELESGARKKKMSSNAPSHLVLAGKNVESGHYREEYWCNAPSFNKYGA